jgi:hypothetical protein
MDTDLRRSGKFLLHNLEAIVWIAAIMIFALSPLPSGEHFSICPLSLAGFEHCPGCGLGRAMILLLHGRVSESISMHPLAIPALALFTARIVIVFKNYFNFQKQITPKTN